MPKHIFAACPNLSVTILFGIGSALAAGVSGQVSAGPANRIASDQPPPVTVNQHTDDAVAPVVREGFIGSPADGQGIRQKQPDNADSMMSMNMQFAKEAAPHESAQFISGTDDGSSTRRKQPNNEAPSGINSPRDPATGQAASVVQSGQGPGSGTAGESFHIEVDGASGGYVSSFIGGTDDGQSMRRKQPGQLPANANNALVNNQTEEDGGRSVVQSRQRNIKFDGVDGEPVESGTATAQPGQYIGGTNDGQSMRRKPPRTKTRKGGRMHKP